MNRTSADRPGHDQGRPRRDGAAPAASIEEVDFRAGAVGKEVSRQVRLLSSELKVLGVEHEYRLSRYAFYVLLAVLLMSFWVGFYVDQKLGIILGGMCVAAALYYRFAVPRLLLRSGSFTARVRLLNVSIEVTLPALVSLIDAWIVGGTYALTSTAPLLTFVVVVASGLRLSRRLSVYAGVLAALEYLVVFSIARQGVPAQLAEHLPTLGWGFAVLHAAYLLLAGGLAALIADVVTGILGRVVDQVVEKERVYDRFGEYVAEDPVSLVVDDDELKQGVRRRVTVLYSDIRDFTSLSYKTDAAAVVTYLNAYFGRICSIIDRSGGIVDKFTGDGCLALFGALDARSGHSLRAARAALEMVKVVAEIERPDGQPTRIGVGLATGEVLVGSIGAPGRRDYTAIGDTVNLASRVEGLTRELGVEVIMTGAVVGEARGCLETRKLGRFEIRGREGTIQLHELLKVKTETDTFF